ncbi:hypothetical protein G7047_11405 [Diaphorobacter sp. HDW4A]|uniref:hypothetical protein n=1 Tax=Diaphorobacter sp. HDW4A TaxID=2714924 RepID=UPI00140D5868|nr:hypothetical protein [Diaphorobacter sp. HDW4A]QIL80440.1 hypothetical protein G7047_11405 [Diaphorobacter sp. HDW4A]
MRKAFVGLLVTLIALVVLAVGVLLLANWNDEPLSDKSRKALTYTAPTENQLRGNGFLVLAGIDAPAPVNPKADAVEPARQLGQQILVREIERWKWNQRLGHTNHANAPKPLAPTSALTRKQILPDELRCPPEQADCIAWFVQRRKQFATPDAHQRAVLSRLANIARAPYCTNVLPNFVAAQGAPYSALFAGFELQLARASLLWNDKAYGEALDLLERGEAVRQCTGASDRLNAGSLATSSMNHATIKWLSNAITRTGDRMRPQDEARIQKLLETLRISIRRGLAAEMTYSASIAHSLGVTLKLPSNADEGEGNATENELSKSDSWIRHARRSVNALLYLPNQTINIITERWTPLVQLADVPPPELKTAEESASDKRESLEEAHAQWHGARNPIGNHLLGITDLSDYVHCIHRAIDTDGYRRLALLQLQAMQQRVAPEKMSQWLADRPEPLRNPWDNQPMQWNTESGTLEFTGLAVQTANPDKSRTYRISLRR